MSLTVHGIPNCDTVKKSRAALAAAEVDHVFRDFKKVPPTPAELERWAGVVGWDALINRRGTTFRALAEADKADLDEARALRLMSAHPSLIKRPVIERGDMVTVGWSEALLAELRG